MLAGDAAGFIDPVFSSGVFLAMMSGEMCADVLDEALTNPKRKHRLFARYTRQFNYAMDCLRAFRQGVVQKGIHRSVFVSAGRSANSTSGKRDARRKCLQRTGRAMAHVGFLLPRFSAEIFPTLSAAHARAQGGE